MGNGWAMKARSKSTQREKRKSNKTDDRRKDARKI